jgi:hypothetical protein
MAATRTWCKAWRTGSVVLLLAGLAACASVPHDGRGGIDAQSLAQAIDLDDVATVEAAVRTGLVSVDRRIPARGYAEGAPLLVLAARAGSLGVVRFLLSAGANANARSPIGETAIMMASYFRVEGEQGSAGSNARHEEVVRLLVAAGAVLENMPGEYTPLAYAAFQGHDRIVRFLLERGARVDGDAHNGVASANTALMMAAMQGHESTLRLLLRAGADPRIRLIGGHTARELAAKNRQRHLAVLLQCAEMLGPRDSYARGCE